jgi:hypothetical protein
MTGGESRSMRNITLRFLYCVRSQRPSRYPLTAHRDDGI